MRIAKARPFEGKPIINMPSVYGGCIGKEIICRVPVIGTRPIRVEVQGLPQGLRLDGQVIRGTVPEGGEFRVRIAAENGLGRAEQDVTFRIGEDTMLLTPLMGFTSWNAFGADVSQEKMEDTAAAMAALGIADYGYCYVNIDSGWQKEYGGEFDAVMPNEKFPDMKGFCRKMHEAGFKCGIYSTPMLTAWGCPKELPSIPGCTRGEPNILFTCNNGGVGKERLEENNVRQWADWGFDYLKYDWAPTEPINADYMKKALLKADREMAFCVTVDADISYREYWKRYCSSWRCNCDSIDRWGNVKGAFRPQEYCRIEYWKDSVTPGHFYDLDMLEIGAMVWNQGKSGLTENEELFAYTLRAFFLSPIQLSCDLQKLTEFERDLISNEEVIRLNQDSLADFPEVFRKNEAEDLLVYKRRLENGDEAYAVFNLSDEEKTEVLDFSGFRGLREVWTKEDRMPDSAYQCVVEPHCAVVLRAVK